MNIQILKDPEPIVYESISRWWTVRAFKKLFKIKNKMIGGYKYTVKVIK